MANRTRHLAAALGPHSDHFYDKSFKHGPSGRRTQKRDSRALSRRARAISKRETARIIRDETR